MLQYPKKVSFPRKTSRRHIKLNFGNRAENHRQKSKKVSLQVREKYEKHFSPKRFFRNLKISFDNSTETFPSNDSLF